MSRLVLRNQQVVGYNGITPRPKASSAVAFKSVERRQAFQPVLGTLPSTLQYLSGLSNVRFGDTNVVSKVAKVAEIHLKDYTPPSHLIDKTDLTFELLAEDNVVVTSKLTVRPNPNAQPVTNTLQLDGAPEKAEEGSETPTMELLELKLNGRVLSSSEYRREGKQLIIENLPDTGFTLEAKTRIAPKTNRALLGLYTSGKTLVTQCEAQGFRNITFYLDRPDVMSEYTTTIIAPKGQYAQLLSNGNPGTLTTTADGREQITWHDPFKKPSYLFAMVAGNFAVKEALFTTKSGRPVTIRIYADHGDEDKIDHAMDSIQCAMKWDEDRFGLEYDLDLFQIVAVSDFNMGAMENKGLNVFNASAILADPSIATDLRYEYIQAIIGHEYFHNYSGDRVTCRDWFQLSLKEGFTVFRDAEFTADLNARAVKRIDDVQGMRTVQFAEDASAMAHPIRPASVGNIENFYTATVYEKGAEVIRMIHTLLGEAAFRKGCDLYFSRHDGQAVTTEDFVRAMEDASGQDLSQFEKTWYNQAGTPVLDVQDAYDSATQEYRLTIRQSTPPTPGQPLKDPFYIPIRVGLLDSTGKDMPLTLDPAQADLLTQGDVLNLKNTETTFVFKNVPEKPIPSLLRNWSAPVKLNYDYSRDALTFLMAHDSDGFNRWEAGQKLGIDILKELVEAHQKGQAGAADSRLIQSFKAVLMDPNLDPLLATKALTLPSEGYLAELYPAGKVDVDAIHAARKQAKEAIGKALESEFLARYQASRSTEQRPYQWNAKDAGERAIKNMALMYLLAADPQKYLPLATAQFDLNHNMTDVRAALTHIVDDADDQTQAEKLDRFYQRHQGNRQAINQWFSAQALADRPNVLDQVKVLLTHKAYDGKNPNQVRSVVGAFASNTVHFHKKDGSGYAFLADQIIEIDKFNPQLAAGLSKTLSAPFKYDPQRQQLIKAQLERIRDHVNSDNVKEIVGKTLALFEAKQVVGAAAP